MQFKHQVSTILWLTLQRQHPFTAVVPPHNHIHTDAQDLPHVPILDLAVTHLHEDVVEAF